MCRRAALLVAIAAVGWTAVAGAGASPAGASILDTLSGGACKLVGTVGEGWMGSACNGALAVAKKVAGAGGKAAKIVKRVAGNPLVARGAGIAAIVAWVLGGAKWTMDHMASVISHTTSPTLTAGWFTGVYLRVQAIALFFTLLFLCAVAAEALLRSEPALLARAVFGYLPLAAIVTAIATPVTMLLLAATDELSVGLARLAGPDATHFLTGTSAWVAAGLTAADPFFAVMAGGLVVAAGGALWVEMLIREVVVYVVVAMLPLVFAAMIWPARRVWAIRTVEVLVALIFAKVAIVVVLALGAAALGHSGAGGLTRLLGGLALVLIGAFSPWVLLRLIPLVEVASAAVGHIRGHLHTTASIRTPEAALAGHAREKLTGHNGTTDPNGVGVLGGVAVPEMLEQMLHRAQAAERSPETAASALSSVGSGRVRSPNGDQSASATIPGDTPAGGRTAAVTPSTPSAGAGETMVQQLDGSWQPLQRADPDAAIPPAPWEPPEDLPPVAADEVSSASPPPIPDPQEGRLGGNAGAAESEDQLRPKDQS